MRTRGDSCGGVVTCVCRGVPRGLGAPVFDKLEADLAHAMLSLPATKGFEVGSGFSGTRQKGTEHNDEFYVSDKGLLRTRSNRSGGIQGGISNGEHIVLRVAFKPTSTVSQPQRTVTRAGEETELRAREHGRVSHERRTRQAARIGRAGRALVVASRLYLRRRCRAWACCRTAAPAPRHGP